MAKQKSYTISKIGKDGGDKVTIPEHHEEQLVLGMFDRGMITFPEGGKTLKSGRKCPYYYNIRRCMSLDKELDRSGRMNLDKQREFRDRLLSAYAIKFSEFQFPVDHVFGRAQAATAPAAVAAFKAGLSHTCGSGFPKKAKKGMAITGELREITAGATLFYWPMT